MEKGKTTNSLHLRLAAIFCLVTIGLITLGAFYYHYEAQRIRNEKFDDLSAIARLKADSIQEWLRNRLADVRRVPGPLVKKEIARLLQDTKNPGSTAALQLQLNINRKGTIYADALFLDIRGNILLSDKPDPGPINQVTMKAIELALKDRTAILSDFFRDSEGHIYIDAVAPIPDNSGNPMAIVVLRSNAEDYLYPLIQTWPISSKTAETLLVRRDGDSVLYLNELRHRPNTALNLRFPLNNTYLPAVQAVLGHYGRFLGKDYRGVNVFAITQPVPDSRWSIVAKVDAEEILEEVIYRAWLITIVVCLLIMILAGLIVRAYRHRQEIDRKQAEEALHLFKDLVEHSSDAIGISTPEGKHYYQNEAFNCLFGNIGDDPPKTVYVDKEIGKQVFDTIMGGRSWQGEVKMFKEDRTILDIFQRAYAIKNKDGGIIGLVGLHTDITERKRTEESLKKSEERFRAIFEHSTIGKSLTATDGKLIQVNKAFADIVGYTIEEVEKINFEKITHPDDIAASQKCVRSLLMGEQTTYRFEKRYIHKNSHIVWADVSATLLRDEQGTPLHIMTSIVDITERKRAEDENRIFAERLQRAEKMEALGTLAGGVAHDLNNVLGIVVGYAEMLMDEIDESSPLRKDVMTIIEGGNRSAAIVQDLLTLARRGVQTQKVINLNDTITDYQKTPEFEALFSLNCHIKLKTDLGTDLLNMMGSPIHLGKTIINLISNAVEAMPGGGMLTITTRNRSLDKPVHGYDTVKENDYVVLSITDTGEGISDHDIKHIFEPFYTKKVMGRSGTGLGLAVVWGTVKDHNGYIDVQSKIGQGTTFTLYFPVTREEIAKAATIIPLSDYIGNDESILVIDDIKEQRELAAKMLGKLNYRVKTVSSGEEAVQYLRDEKVDLLVLDMIMEPGMDGLDAYKAILEIHPKQKAIIVSGFSETERVKEAMSLGAGGYLRKPYVQEKLGLAVRTELDKKYFNPG